MNVSATLSAFKLLAKPSVCLPHATVPTFDGISLPISKTLDLANGGQEPNIRAVVLDKDNCFAKPRENIVYLPYVTVFENLLLNHNFEYLQDYFQTLRKAYPGSRLLIVSNSAGTNDDPYGEEAKLLEDATGVEVFRHSIKKPGCGLDVFNHLRGDSTTGVEHPGQIMVVGDRLFTDIMMANMMGAWSIWVKDGVVKNDGVFSRLEKGMPNFWTRLGFQAPIPRTSH